MENYKKEMFEYLSKPENYASAKEVAKLLPDLEKSSHDYFLDRLRNHLEELSKQDTDFIFIKEDNLRLHLNESIFFGVTLNIQYLWFGIWNEQELTLDNNKKNEITEKYKNLLFSKSKTYGFFTYDDYPGVIAKMKKFVIDKDYSDILNDNQRNELAKEVAEYIWKYAKDSKEMCKELLEIT
jgi:5-formaminoimidazole-4-carboxamide-1-beta-D-ribofuranosyl 5'-monophosphate synthetase